MISFKAMDTFHEWQWFQSRTHVLRCEDTQGIVAYDKGAICAVVVFDTWTPVAVNVHIALENPWAIRSGLFVEVAVHAFHTAGRQRMFGLVPQDNEKAIKLNEHIGFRKVAQVDDTMGDGCGTIVMRLDADDCRYLPDQLRKVA